MKVIYYDVVHNQEIEKELGTTYLDTEEVFTKAVFISLNLPLLPSTRHSIDAALLKQY